MEKLDKKNIEDILALTPMQEGMLFHYLKDPQCGYYFIQLSLEISGAINVQYFEKAWNFVIETNEMLRTVFLWKKLKAPIQIILKSHKIEIRNHDLSNQDISLKNKLIEEIKAKDRSNKFDLQEPPLRLTLVKISEKQYNLIVSNHHILYDGWSNAVILQQFVQVYKSLIKSEKVMQVKAPPYRNYINWLNNQDKREGLRYWEEYLSGYDRQATLPVPGTPGRINGRYKREEYSFVIGESLAEGLKEIAGNNQVSFNAAFQTIWGILLHHYNNTDDVVFGAVVSGRTFEIKDINHMVGLFINTIPVRVKISNKYSFLELLKVVQENMILSTPYEYVPLAEIQEHSLLKENLIDHILSFQNYPLKKEDISAGEDSGFKIERADSLEQTNYDFNFILFPNRQFNAKLLFNSLKYPFKSIKKIVLHFNEILRQVVVNSCIDVRKIEIITGIKSEKPMRTIRSKHEGKTGTQHVQNKMVERTGLKKIEADFDF